MYKHMKIRNKTLCIMNALFLDFYIFRKKQEFVRNNTYILGYYNPSVRIIYLVSHTTYVVFVNFIHKWR